MKHLQQKKARTDYLGLIGLSLLFIAGCMITYYAATEKISKCSGNPLVYGIENLIWDEPNLTYNSFKVSLYDADQFDLPVKEYRFFLTQEALDNFNRQTARENDGLISKSNFSLDDYIIK